jgi:hypothetical protein
VNDGMDLIERATVASLETSAFGPVEAGPAAAEGYETRELGPLSRPPRVARRPGNFCRSVALIKHRRS